MGLVVQAPADTLLATTGLPTVAAGWPLPAAPCGDVFASLLASLSGSFKASCEENIQLPNPSGIELLPTAEDADPAEGAARRTPRDGNPDRRPAAGAGVRGATGRGFRPNRLARENRFQ